MNEIEEEISSFEPGVFKPTRRTLVRFEFEELCTDFAVFDDSFVASGYYELFGGRAFDLTLIDFRIVNLSEALNDSYLSVDGTETITFTDGDFGGAPDPNSYPTELFSLPASGVFDLFCSQLVPAGSFVRFYPGYFVDGGVISSGLYAELYYTYNCADAE